MSYLAVTAGEMLRWASRRLGDAGVDSPALDAELLLAHVLNSDRTSLLAHPKRTLEMGQTEQFRALVGRREQREPLAYILGHKEFYGLDFRVDRRVLIPRPETEELVRHALTWIQQHVDETLLVADVGTGSGAVAVALAHHAPAVTVYALDRSTDALAIARENLRRHGLESRVHLYVGDLLKPLTEPVDLIVANLPYIGADEFDSLMPEVREYEPKVALDGGADGLDMVRRLLEEAPSRLRAGGAVMLEIGARQREAASSLARMAFPNASVRMERDLAGLDRVLIVETSPGALESRESTPLKSPQEMPCHTD